MIDDLRGFLDALKERGKFRVVNNADWDLEIGTINELMAERQGPALLFDNIKAIPKASAGHQFDASQGGPEIGIWFSRRNKRS